MKEIDERIPDKMRLDQAIRYFENVITSNNNFVNNEFETSELIESFDFPKCFANIPKILPNFEQSDEEVANVSNETEEEKVPYSQGCFVKSQIERYNEMTKYSYLFLIYCYLSFNNYDKALEYCKILKSDFKLNSKLNFELKMYMAEIYLQKGKANEAFKCLKVDQAFEESKEGISQSELSENFIAVENLVSGVQEAPLPRRAIMFLNIAT